MLRAPDPSDYPTIYPACLSKCSCTVTHASSPSPPCVCSVRRTLDAASDLPQQASQNRLPCTTASCFSLCVRCIHTRYSDLDASASTNSTSCCVSTSALSTLFLHTPGPGGPAAPSLFPKALQSWRSGPHPPSLPNRVRHAPACTSAMSSAALVRKFCKSHTLLPDVESNSLSAHWQNHSGLAACPATGQ